MKLSNSLSAAMLALLLAGCGAGAQNGNDGNDGEDGQPGSEGKNSVLNVTHEPAGENCATGGIKIENGIDDNANDVLDSEEVAGTEYVCNGLPIGHSSLITWTTEPSGTNCLNGGFLISSGLDSNDNQVLETGEVTQSEYLCHGVDGTDGDNGLPSLVRMDASVGANCPATGTRILVGLDDNGDGALDNPEIDYIDYVCDGETPNFGTNAVVTSFAESLTSVGTTATTLRTATINATGPGTVVAIATADVYCSATGTPTCGSANPAGFLAITSSSTASPEFASARDYFILEPGRTESVTRMGQFAVAGAGDRTYYLRGLAETGSTIGFWRKQLMLIFIPST